MTIICPGCGADDAAICGHVERGVYDGVLWWECFDCGHAWPRNFGLGMERRNAAARVCADEHNAARTGAQ